MTHTYIVAEIGQNHNGDLETARRLIDAVAGPIVDHYTGEELPGVDAVKFTKRDLDHEYTVEMRDSPYDSPHSYGRTYGEHREALELDTQQLSTLREYANASGLEFGLTACHPSIVGGFGEGHIAEYWELYPPAWWKVASRDVGNGPLLERLNEQSEVPVVLSGGMCTWQEMAVALDTLKHCNVTLLHCLSAYPAPYNDLNMARIRRLQNLGYRVGYSSHTADDWMAVAAVGMGCEWLECHVTLSNHSKGTDHACSLEPDAFRRIVGRVRHLERALGTSEDTNERRAAYRAAQVKLGRSICTARDLTAGTVLTRDDIELLSPGTGYPWSDVTRVIDHELTEDLPAQTLIEPAHLLTPTGATV